jgi:hypothetical protein
MTHLNVGSSIYHEIQALYWRRPSGELTAIEGRRAKEVKERWSELWELVSTHAHERETVRPPSGALAEGPVFSILDLASNDCPFQILPIWTPLAGHTKSPCTVLRVQEMNHPGEGLVIGVLSLAPPMAEGDAGFRDWVGRFILTETRLSRSHVLRTANVAEDVTAWELSLQITKIFEEKLQHLAPHDQWMDGGGRYYFQERVFAFTKCQTRVDFCLPAFPCKSTNVRKTIGALPDRAERIALDVLRCFTASITAIYSPGAMIWIVSDGHVFSDCSKSGVTTHEMN